VTKGENKPSLTLFTRLGLSDGKTSPFKGGFQAGMLIGEPFRGRPDSAISLGLHSGWLSKGFRLAQQSSGIAPTKHETALELTYTDRLMQHVSFQPDVQYIVHPGGDAAARDAIVTTLRMTFDF
jgi:porin